jgi:hypothetical protein
MSDEKEKPKIIIDEDWKSQVEAERERLKTQGTQPEPKSTQPHGSLPSASFELLISSLATQTLIELGQIPDPLDNRHSVQLDLAQHHIDMLSMLEQKTKGNLSSDETRILKEVLHQLRMAYVSVSGQVKKDQSAGPKT